MRATLALREGFPIAGWRLSTRSMTTSIEPQTIPPIVVESGSRASFTADALDAAALCALSIRAMQAAATALAGAASAKLVSISHDVTGTSFDGGSAAVESRADRQTRTLIFMSAELSSAAGLHVRSTAIFRLDAA